MTNEPIKMMMMDAARHYAELGFKVFPCATNGKTPITPHGVLDATDDTKQIESWWTAHPTSNIGLATQGLLVVDIDGENNQWLTNSPEKLTDLATSPIARTPRGGRHHIFRQPDGAGLRNTAGALAEKIDTRADGGYIVVSPSVVPPGVYDWIPQFELDCGPNDLPEPPQWLMDLLEGNGKPRIAVTSNGNAIPDGQRNHTLARVAGHMRRAGMSQPEILAAIQVANATRCKPPLENEEVEKIAWSVARYQPDQITVGMVEAHWEQDHSSDENHRIEDPGHFPAHLLNVPGLISEVMRWNLKTAFKPQPELALAGAIALMGTLAGRKVRDHTNSRTNVYILGICGTGGGKDHSRTVNKRILFESGLERLIGPEGIASHSGLVNAVEASPSALFQLDEIGRLLQTLKNPAAAPHLYNIVTVLMKLFTSSGNVFMADAYSDTKRNKRINQPNACVYGTTVPRSFYESMTREAMTDGFMSRLMVIEATNQDPELSPDADDGAPIPQNIIETARAWGQLVPGGNLNGENPTPMMVESTPQAMQVMTDMESETRKIRKSSAEHVASMWTRAVQKARKLALIYACSEGGVTPKITDQAATWGAAVATHLTQRAVHAAEEWIADGRWEGEQKRVLRVVKAAGGKASRTQLARSLRNLNARERNEVLATLCEIGELRIEIEHTDGRYRERYVIPDR